MDLAILLRRLLQLPVTHANPQPHIVDGIRQQQPQNRSIRCINIVRTGSELVSLCRHFLTIVHHAFIHFDALDDKQP